MKYLNTVSFKKYLLIGLTCIALWQLGQGVFMQAKAQLAQHLIARAWQLNVEQGGGKKIKPWFYADTWPIAKLTVPRLNIEEHILWDASGRNLVFGAAHFLPSASLEELVNYERGKSSLIAGHNDTNFAFLSQLKLGDIYELALESGLIMQYQVSNISIIHQSDTAFLQANLNSVNHLYLMTCYPFNTLISGTQQRYLVESVLI